MNTKASKHPQFGNSVHLVSPEPKMIEFISERKRVAICKHALQQAILERNSAQKDTRHDAPDQLRLIFNGASIVLKGWRLEMMLGPLASGTVATVQTVDKELAKLMIEEPWVTEIHFTSPSFSNQNTETRPRL